jgi:DnaJ family protein A protein 2
MFSGGFPFGFNMGGGHHHGEDGPGISEEDTPNRAVDNKKLYEVLGVDEKAQPNEIKKAYLKLAKTLHPDKGGSKEKFSEIQEAYEILTNEEKREMYNKYGLDAARNGGPTGGAGFDDIFSFLGGGGRGGMGGGRGGKPQQRKGKPVLKELKVKLEDVYNGKSVKLPHQKYILCEKCDGKGGSKVNTCGPCKGKGSIEKVIQFGPGMYSHASQPCNECRGQGKSISEKDKCKDCNGEKIKRITKTIEVTIEPGVPHEHDIVHAAEGDEVPGVSPGDVVVRVTIEPHPVFARKGADLKIEKTITLLEALSGCNFEIEHLDGKKLTVTTLPGEVISSGDIKTVKKKGLPFYKDPMGHGNLFVHFKVEFPKKGELKGEQLDQLRKILPGPKVAPFDRSKPFEYLDEYHETETNPNPEGGKTKEEEEEEDGGQRGGQRVQCAQQ